MTREEARLLPVIEWEGREFLADIDAMRFRNVDDASDLIDMHSPQDRAIVRQMEGKQWTVHVVDTGSQEDAVV